MNSKIKNEKSKIISDPQSATGNPKSKIKNPKSDPLRILILEDVPTDAELVERELRNAGITFTSKLVDTRDGFVKQLENFSPDIILSDYSMPQFNGMEALELVKERYPSIPLIIVTGSMNEETAVECMKAGAADYVIKEHLTRLGTAVKGALKNKRIKEEKERAEERIEHLNLVLYAIRKVNQLIVREEDRDRLLQSVCDLFIENRGYYNAWIVLLDDNRELITTAESGLGEVFLPMIERLKRGELTDCGQKALKQSGVVVTEDPHSVCAGCPLSDKYAGKGAMTVRLAHGEKIYGLVSVSIPAHFSTDEEEQLLFKDISKDIAFALHGIEQEEERKRAEEERKSLEAQLQQAQKMEAIGTLAGGIAHDFNNILSLIIGYTELTMRDLPEDSRAQDNMNKAFKASERAKNLVKQILAFSRQTEQEQKPVQIHLIVKESLKLLRPTLPTTIEIHQNITSTGTVMADPTQMHQVLMNLCTNAYHAMQEKGGVLEVSLTDVELDSDYTTKHLDTHPGPYLKLTVSDTGHGMEKKVIDRIFDPYYTTKDKTGGTGMGLAVVHGILKSHGGVITVYSEPGKGTTFNVFLPRTESSEAVVEPEEIIPLPTGKERILFVDDEPAIVDIGKSMLEHLGYTVVTRTSSIEALEAFKAQPDKFDLAITDMTMPNMTGDELAKELMRIRPDLPIILCTGFSELINEHKAKAMGIRAFVMKPIVQREMANAVRKALDK